jgi:hypothetical protein
MKLFREPVAMVLLVLSLTAWQHPAGHSHGRSGQSAELTLEPADEVSGRGFWSALGCMGCVVGGVAIASGGWAAIVTAASSPKSTLILGACVGACARALGVDELL